MTKKKLSEYVLPLLEKSPRHPSNAPFEHPGLQDQLVISVTSDSRQIQKGSIFVAICGGTQDGHQFISAAEKQGAILVVGEQELPPGTLSIPYLRVKDGRQALAKLAAIHFENPSHSMLMIGVTGTSGKTTTTYLLESILQSAGYEVGVIGTINFRYGPKIFPSTHTTPGSVELQDLLAQMKLAGCTAVVMEVSSHALKQHRVDEIAFDGMIFTNLSPEHLDFHPNMEDYFSSKSILFKDLAEAAVLAGKTPVAAINTNDFYGQRLFEEVSNLKYHSQLTLQAERFEEVQNLKVSIDGIQGGLGGTQIRSPLTGEFNRLNISGAVTLAKALKIDPRAVEKGVLSLNGIPGRLERVENSCQVHIWVDYAHKPDALEKVISTLKKVKGANRLLTVVGCGGDRDRKKRPMMGRIAAEGSDQVFVTSDNPRTEDPMAIIQEILVGTREYSNVTVEVDRKKAIFAAVHESQPGDLVLIAGKGHEDYQIIGTTKIHFDDREVAREASQLKRKISE